MRSDNHSYDAVIKGELKTVQINMRSIVQMDNEPSYFLQSFQGSMITKTNEYLQRDPTFIASEMDEEQYVMMF